MNQHLYYLLYVIKNVISRINAYFVIVPLLSGVLII